MVSVLPQLPQKRTSSAPLEPKRSIPKAFGARARCEELSALQMKQFLRISVPKTHGLKALRRHLSPRRPTSPSSIASAFSAFTFLQHWGQELADHIMTSTCIRCIDRFPGCI